MWVNPIVTTPLIATARTPTWILAHAAVPLAGVHARCPGDHRHESRNVRILPPPAWCAAVVDALRLAPATIENHRRLSCLLRMQDKLDEEMDDVKHMNQMMLYSKVVTIRDAQVQEKRTVQTQHWLHKLGHAPRIACL